MALSITSTTKDEVIVVRLSGAILFGEESVSMRIRVTDLLGKSSQIVLDLGDVTRIDSAGLGTLVALYASARKVGGNIKLANLGNHAKEVLQITRLVTVFEIFGKTEDAILQNGHSSSVNTPQATMDSMIGRVEQWRVAGFA
jgi:anti-sigma B factor antagonist